MLFSDEATLDKWRRKLGNRFEHKEGRVVWIHGPSWFAAWRDAASSASKPAASVDQVGRSPDDLVSHAERKVKAQADLAELDVQVRLGELIRVEDVRPDIEYSAEPFRTAAETMCPSCKQKQLEACDESMVRLAERFPDE